MGTVALNFPFKIGVWIVILALSGILQAQEKIIAEVDIEGLETISKEEILSNLKTRVGTAFSRKAVEEDKKTLSELYYFTRIDVKQQPLPGSQVAVIFQVEEKVVAEVDIDGLKTLSKNEIKNRLKTKAGKAFSVRALRDDIQTLHNMYYFSDIKLWEKKLEGNKYKIIFVVEEKEKPLGEVYIEGNFEIDDETIKKELRIYKQKFLDDYVLPLDVLTIKEMYRKAGYLFADVKMKPKEDDGWVDLHIVIDEGPEVTVEEIHFFGNRFFSKEDLLAFTQTQESGLFSNKYYNKEEFEKDLLLIRNFYRSEGFLDVRVELRDLFFSNDRTGVRLNISVDEGVRYNVRNIAIKGNTLFANREFENRMELKSESPFLQAKMAEDATKIRRLYSDNGFMDVKVDPVVTLHRNDFLVDITYKIEEGTDSYIRKIEIDGNVLTRDDVIRRDLLIKPGERFSYGKIEESKIRVGRRNYFEPPIQIDIKDTDQPAWKDMNIKVEEGRTGSLRFAAGITSDLGAIGEISLTKRNFDITDPPTSFADFFSGESFTGAGQKLDIFFQAGQEVLRFKISFEEPYIFGYNLSFGTDIYKTERVRESWNEGRTGAQISFGRLIDRDTRLWLRYRFEEVKINHVDNGAPSDVFAVEGKSKLSGLSVGLTIDTRDNFILPTRGYILSGSYELAGKFLGGDHDFSKADFRAAWFQTIYTTDDNFKHVISIGGRVGMSGEHSPSTSVPIFERFFAGGATSIRGFEFRTVGPKENGDPIGGEFMVLGTIEYGFPLYRDVLRGVVFTDVGNVISRVDSTILNDMRVSVGVGVRLKVPMLGPRPFAFDFGFPMREEDDDSKQIFSFSFGKPF